MVIGYSFDGRAKKPREKIDPNIFSRVLSGEQKAVTQMSDLS